MALIFAYYFVFINAANIEKNILKQLHAYADYLSQPSEYAIFTANYDLINKQLKLLTSNPEINSISIYNKDQVEVVTESSTLDIEKNILFDTFYYFFRKNYVLNKEIKTESISIYDFEEDVDNKQQSLGKINFDINSEYIFYKKYLAASYGFYITFIIYLFALYSALRFSRKITDGIENIDQTLNDIESGNLYARVDRNLVDKFGNISQGIEKMANAIKMSDDQLREKIDVATYKLHAYNKEIIRNNRKLLKAREQAEQANAAKTNFLSNISHEIRTPVNGIIGFTDLLLSSDIKEEYKQYIQNIDDASNKLLRLINDLLDFSRLESEHIHIEVSQFNLYDLAAKLHAFYSVNRKNKNVEVYLDIDPDTPQYIFSDEYKLEQIITNLFSNAIKFTPEGHVKLHIHSNIHDQNNCDIFIKVSDTGIGIAKENHKSIFNKFEQADISTNIHFGGSGLGLSIAAVLAEKLNGTINVNSELGKGSTFTLALKTQYQSASFEQKFFNMTLDYYDEDEFHYQSLSNLLKQAGCNISRLSIDQAAGHQNQILLCGFKSQQAANDFLLSKNWQKDNSKSRFCFCSFYDKKIYTDFKQHGFQHIGLRTYRLDLLAKLINQETHTPQTCLPIKQSHVQAMIIDDNSINVVLLEKYLNKLGVKTVSSSCALRAFDILGDFKPNIILTDLHMPNLNGIDLSLKIRQHYTDLHDVPIIAITADGTKSNHQHALNNGIQEVLLKPISFDIIKQKLVTYTNMISIEQEEYKINKMRTPNVEKMLIKELPVFADEINVGVKNNDLKQLYQTIHRLVGGLEYCIEYEGLLEKAKIAYEAIATEKESVNNIESEIHNLLKAIDKEFNLQQK